MPDPNNLPYLIRLLDDESEIVRESVLRELSTFGPFLEIELSRSNIPTNAEQRTHIRNLLGQHSRSWLQRVWPEWRNEPTDKGRLERAMSLVAEFQYGPGYPASLKTTLDKCAAEFRKHSTAPTPLTLASFLFKTKGLRGAEKDYYNPFHSNLQYVLEEGRGNPLSLSAVYMLVGDRVGLDIEGCNFPGHFLARARQGEDTYVVDCFNGGRFLESSDILALNKGATSQIGELLRMDCPAEVIIGRLLRNLIHAYRQEDKPEHTELFSGFLRELETDPPEEDPDE